MMLLTLHKKIQLFSCLAIILLSLQIKATNLVEVLPVTNKIVQLKFIDGSIKYHGIGTSRYDDVVTLFPGGRIDAPTASVTGIYEITSSNDANYTAIVNPLSVGVNIRSEQTWEYSANSQKYIQTVYVYLQLATPLVNGKTYTINVNSAKVNTNAKTLSFIYDTKNIRSEAVHVNNLGYVPSAASKYGYVYLWMGDKGGLRLDTAAYGHISPIQSGQNRKARILRNSDKLEVFTCNIVFRKPANNLEFFDYGTPDNNFLGSQVWECDFSSFNTPGTYVLSVDEIGSSFPFEIGNEIYKEPFYWTIKSIYENRSGIALHAPYAQYERPAPHRPGVTPGFKLYYSSIRHYDLTNSDADYADTVAINANIKGQVDTWGWYQDAGDWDSYNTHAKIPAYLMFLFETNPSKFAHLNLDLENESNNGLPDMLDEARWLVRFYKRSKDAINNTTLGGTGGVPGGRVFGDDYPNSDHSNVEDAVGSWQDNKRKWVMLGEDVWMTYTYAALAAHFASILEANGYTDPEGINWKVEAENAWTWAQAKQTASDETFKWEYKLGLLRMYAASALYRLTDDKAKYESVFIYDLSHTNTPYNGLYSSNAYYGFLSLEDVAVFAYSMYNLASDVVTNEDAPTKTLVKEALKASAGYLAGLNDFPQIISRRACRWGGGAYVPMGVGQGTTPLLQIIPMSYAAFVVSDPTLANEWLKNTYTTADYFLGTNPLNMTYVSGLGERSPEQFFHMDAFYCTNSTVGGIPKKGIVPYGPIRNCILDLAGCGGVGQGSFNYYYGLAKGKAYPMGRDDITSGSNAPERPGHERYMPSRTAPIVNEFTVHQNSIAAAMTYGFLWSRTGASPTDNVAPTSPLYLTASEIGRTSFTLNWLPSSDISGNIVYRVIRNGSTLTTTSGTSFTFTGLAELTLYSVSVSGMDMNGNTSPYVSISVITKSVDSDVTAPSTPINLSASNITTTGFTLNWGASTDNIAVVGYDIYKDAVKIGSVSGTSFEVSGLEPDITYLMGIKAFDSELNYSPSADLAIKTSGLTSVMALKERNKKVSIYPQPAKDILNIIIRGAGDNLAKVTIINALGMEVLNVENRMHNDQLTFPLLFPCGFYTIHISTLNAFYTGKLIIE